MINSKIVFSQNCFSQFQHLVSPENVEHVKMRCDEAYHKVAGTEVTEVQDRVSLLLLLSKTDLFEFLFYVSTNVANIC